MLYRKRTGAAPNQTTPVAVSRRFASDTALEDLSCAIRLQSHLTAHRGLYATRSSAVPCFLGLTTISTSCPSATRKRMRRSTEYPRNRPASIAEILG